jgi:hypothetical protein
MGNNHPAQLQHRRQHPRPPGPYASDVPSLPFEKLASSAKRAQEGKHTGMQRVVISTARSPVARLPSRRTVTTAGPLARHRLGPRARTPLGLAPRALARGHQPHRRRSEALCRLGHAPLQPGSRRPRERPTHGARERRPRSVAVLRRGLPGGRHGRPRVGQQRRPLDLCRVGRIPYRSTRPRGASTSKEYGRGGGHPRRPVPPGRGPGLDHVRVFRQAARAEPSQIPKPRRPQRSLPLRLGQEVQAPAAWTSHRTEPRGLGGRDPQAAKALRLLAASLCSVKCSSVCSLLVSLHAARHQTSRWRASRRRGVPTTSWASRWPCATPAPRTPTTPGASRRPGPPTTRTKAGGRRQSRRNSNRSSRACRKGSSSTKREELTSYRTVTIPPGHRVVVQVSKGIGLGNRDDKEHRTVVPLP